MNLSGDDILGTGPKKSAYNPNAERIMPSRVEDILTKVTTDPPEKDLHTIPPLSDPQNLHEALKDRWAVVKEAARHTERVPIEKLQRITDQFLNDGLPLPRVKELAAMKVNQSTLEACQSILEELSPGRLATVDEIEGIVAVARAIMYFSMLHHGEKPAKTSGVGLKTPFMAWQIKESINHLVSTVEPKLVEPGGFDNTKPVQQFRDNFSTSDIVLWNKNIWDAAIRKCEAFEGTKMEKDVVESVTPMFWQYDHPFSLTGPENKFFDLDSTEYECCGFVIMQTSEDLVKVKLPANSFEVVEKKGDRELLKIDNAAEGVREAFQGGMQFSRSGIFAAIIFLPVNGDGAAEVRFRAPIYEDDVIHGTLNCAIMAALKFLTLKYVAKDSVQISRRELKQDRSLFKKVRHGKVQVPPIKIINLRKAEVRTKKEHDEENKTTRVYHCHFMVDPHWRKQKYGGGKVKVIRILTYVKGDLTKPFKSPREKVYKAVR